MPQGQGNLSFEELRCLCLEQGAWTRSPEVLALLCDLVILVYRLVPKTWALYPELGMVLLDLGYLRHTTAYIL